MRHGEWYWVNKVVIQEYAKRLGQLATSVYHFLASMADENQSCYPSQKYIAERIGCSRVSVNRAVGRLVENRLISMWKTPGKSTMYHLLPVRMLNNDTHLSNKSTHAVLKMSTNNNKGTRNKNNKIVGVNDSYTPKKESDNEADLKAKEELLAHDLSESLDDKEHFERYLRYAREYPENLLRHALSETKATPDSKIRKSRAALFSYLVHHYARKED